MEDRNMGEARRPGFLEGKRDGVIASACECKMQVMLTRQCKARYSTAQQT